MDEKIYRTMKGTGAMNIVLGIIAMVTGIVSGTLLIIGGAKLLSGKSKIISDFTGCLLCGGRRRKLIFPAAARGTLDSSRSGFVNSFTGKTEEADGT